MKTREFDFTSAAGLPLEGRLELPNGAPRAYAVFAHCFTCTKHSIAAVRIARALTAKGIGVLRFDFTGLGEQEDGSPEYADTFSGNVDDVVAATHALAAAGKSPALLIGHSLGGAAVLAAASSLADVTCVTTIGAPFDVDHVTGLLGDELRAIMETGDAEVSLGGRRVRVSRSFVNDLPGHDQGLRIAELRRALLVLHSPVDEIVGIDNAAAIFAAARHPKSFVTLDQADHLLTDPGSAEYVGTLTAEWAQPYLGRPAPD